MMPMYRLFFGLLVVLLAACASVDDVMMKENHRAARELIRSGSPELGMSSTMIAATFANIDNLSSSSSFGRIASQQIVSRFTSSGFNVVDILLRNNIYVSESEGEFLLSREIENIRSDYKADVVLVGTYAVGNRQVFITAKLIRTTDGVIIAAHDYVLPYTGEIRALITGEQEEDSSLIRSLLGLDEPDF